MDRKFIVYIFLIKIRNEKEFFNNIYPAIFEIAIIKIPLARILISGIHKRIKNIISFLIIGIKIYARLH